MGNYYKNTRTSQPVMYSSRYSADYGLPLGSFFLSKETCLSYRTKGNGELIFDYKADPYAYFLRTSSEIKRKSAEQKYGKPSSKIVEGTQPESKSDSKLNVPIVDNGHAFYTQKLKLSSDRLNGPYTYGRNAGTTPVKMSHLFATNARVSTLASARMPFQFTDAKGYSTRAFGINVPEVSTVNAQYYGQKAIGVLAPNRPSISLAAMLGELREGLPSISGTLLLQTRAKSLKDNVKGLVKKGADEYVNLSFGLVPLVADIVHTIEALQKASQWLVQYERDAGKGVRRTMSFPVVDQKATFSGSDLEWDGVIIGSPPSTFTTPGSQQTGFYMGDAWKSTLTMRHTERVWFSGSFTYFIPQGGNLASNIQKYGFMVDRFMGTSMTPEALWQLAPWSWLLDWLFDIGSSISAIQRLADDSLVINYGYLMATTTNVATQETNVTGPNSKYCSVGSCRTTIRSVRKERIRANPYGFSSTTPEGFNPTQWSILAALGLSRM